MKLLEKILLATDFSKSSENVLNNAISLAKIFKSKIILVHVMPEDIQNEKAQLLLDKAAMSELERINDRIKGEGIETFNPVLEYGSHCDKIVKTAEKYDVNGLIIGSGAKSDEDLYKLGTTADKVIRKCDKPVWVVKHDSPLNIKKLLCPVDFSAESERALNNAIIMAHRLDAELVVLSVSELEYTGSLSLSYDWKDLKDYLTAENNRLFDKFLEKFNFTDLKWSKETKTGDPSKEILSAISRHKIDLLIIGTTGKTGLNRLVMGSVTAKVIRNVPCSFITLKSEDIIDLQLETKIRDIETHYKNAKQLVKDGFFEDAINEYKICLHINEMHIPSLNAIAKIYEKLKKENSAVKYRSRAKEVLERLWDRKIEAEIRKFYKF
ncbi:MAG: universal stress protein [Bacteroidota bacterium]